MKDIDEKVKKIIYMYRSRGNFSFEGITQAINHDKKLSEAEKLYIIECMERFQEILQKEEVSGLSGEEIFDRYYTQILGYTQGSNPLKRQYDMSYLTADITDETDYSKLLNRSESGNVLRYEKEDDEYLVLDESGERKVEIKSIGRLTYIDRQVPDFRCR